MEHGGLVVEVLGMIQCGDRKALCTLENYFLIGCDQYI